MTDIQILYEGPIVKRSDAKTSGDKFYFTGKHCKRGHVDKRYTKNATCRECRIRSHKESYTLKPPNPVTYATYSGPIISRNLARSQGLTRFFTGKPCIHGHVSEQYVSTYTCLECQLLRYKNMNKEVIKRRFKNYKENNREKINAHKRNRRARIKSAEGTHTANDIDAMLQAQNNKCAEPTCRKDLSDGYHVDHIMPIKLGGSNCPKNLQCLCPSCNLSKGANNPIDWARKNGRLL